MLQNKRKKLIEKIMKPYSSCFVLRVLCKWLIRIHGSRLSTETRKAFEQKHKNFRGVDKGSSSLLEILPIVEYDRLEVWIHGEAFFSIKMCPDLYLQPNYWINYKRATFLACFKCKSKLKTYGIKMLCNLRSVTDVQIFTHSGE